MSLGIQKYLTAVSLKVSMSLFLCAARVSNSDLICRRWIFLVFFFSLFSFKNYNLILLVVCWYLVVGILISIHIFLIYDFWYWYFCRSFIIFQFHY
jgi:hypothetical protein